MDRYLDTPQCLNKKVVMLAGSLNTEGASDPTILNGLGFTASRSGAGTIQVVFGTTRKDLQSKTLACVVSGSVALTSEYVNTAGMCVIDITLTAGDATNEQVNFFHVFQNSDIPAK